MEIENGREERESREEEISSPPLPFLPQDIKDRKGKAKPGREASH